VEIKKIVLYFCIGSFLTGCYQSSAMVGPAITLASTGNVSQAGLTYITNKAVKEETGMTATEYVSTILEERNNTTEKIDEELLILVQTNFEQTRKKLLLQNQSKTTN
jgi:F420-0:gamma-glutamyl ligase-like protein